MSKVVDVEKTFGALLIGGILATLFCGLTQAQTFVYFRLYSGDIFSVQVLVVGVWLLDTLHTIFISLSLWHYLITGFGVAAGIDYVPTSLALTIGITAVLTFLVHWFFIYRVFVLSKRSFVLCVPLGLLATARLCFASLTTAKLIELRSLDKFIDDYSFSFTTGLTLAAIFDLLIMVLMCWLLKIRQREHSKLNAVLDSLILYALEYGILTSVAASVSLITWLAMKHNLIFMASHFIIIKFYANSLLATLNARRDMKPGGRSNQSVTGAMTNHALNHIRSVNQPIVFSNGYSVGGPGHRSGGNRRPISSVSAFSEPTIDKRDMFESLDITRIDEDEPESSRHAMNVRTTRLTAAEIEGAVPALASGRSHV
ncbi:hypothetical protein BKA70DRAFT_1423696 [Coprinopsis sp. MPI-PUGE-AT-0042]|nr:hypothetical protein BKA70DRAFT_1423696 [Coprinopsis sp. MPI-PUGE-AT-0042]